MIAVFKKYVIIECDIINCTNQSEAQVKTKREAVEFFEKNGWFFNGRVSYCPECIKNRNGKTGNIKW